jgi:cell fate regulator YaaT (PSP1 superfamily)
METTKDKAETGRGSWPKQRRMLVRYGRMGLLGYFVHEEREIPPTWKHVIVQTERGLEVGEIVSPFCREHGGGAITEERLDKFCQGSGSNAYPLSRQGRFVRQATPQDLNEQRHLDESGKGEFAFCEALIATHNLPMTLVDVEHLFGGDRIIYYFMADHRVDFRSLVKELAHEYQTRIEMRQIGARDEARLLADFETCGRQCCCKNFLKVLQPVNMRMAKQQKATLDPSKISGRCGRLKCCLRYEDKVYSHLTKSLPKTGSWVRTEQGVGQVIDRQVLTQLVKVRLMTGRLTAVNVSELLERDLPRPEPTQPSTTGRETPDRGDRNGRGNGRSDRPRREPAETNTAETMVQEAPSENLPTDGGGDQPRKKRRRRRKKRRSSGEGGESGSAQGGGEGNPS